jgi:hypothetical protein
MLYEKKKKDTFVAEERGLDSCTFHFAESVGSISG